MQATHTDNLDKLTEFLPLDEDVQPGFVVDFINRIFSKPQIDAGAAVDKILCEEVGACASSTNENSAPDRRMDVDCRPLNLVAERLTSLLSAPEANSTDSALSARQRSPQVLLDYEQSDFRQYWMPDSKCKQCFECGEKFTTFKRRHHCRICGQIFCSRCCKHEIAGRLLGYLGNLRLCNFCSKSVAVYLTSTCSGISENSSFEQKASFDDTTKFCNDSLKRAGSLSDLRSTQRKASPLMEPANFLTARDSSSQPDRKISLPAPTRLVYKKSIDNFVGAKLDTRSGPQISEKSTLLNVSHSSSSNQISSHIPTVQSSSTFLFDDIEPDEPDWLKNIQNQPPTSIEGCLPPETSDDCANNAEGTDQSASGPNLRRVVSGKIEPETSSTPSFGALGDFADSASYAKEFVEPVTKLSAAVATPPSLSLTTVKRPGRTNDNNRPTFSSDDDPLMASFEQQALRLIAHLLDLFDLPRLEWTSVIWPLVREIAFTVQPDVKLRQDDMDASAYVHVKTLLASEEGAKPGVRVVFGTVCTKTLADNRMKQTFSHPKILLISGSIEYERIEGKFCSLDPVLLQEFEHLRSVVFKIASRKPDVVIVENFVARIAKTLLREAGITVICNVKRRVLERIARCTQAEIIQKIEGQILQPNLGICGSLKVETVPECRIYANSHENTRERSRSLICFEDCPPHLGCTLVLTGPNFNQLKSAKRIVKLCVQQLYSAKLEMAMLRSLDFEIEAENQIVELAHSNRVPCEICEQEGSQPFADISAEYAGVKSNDGSKRRVSEPVFYVSPFINVSWPYADVLFELEEQEKFGRCDLSEKAYFADAGMSGLRDFLNEGVNDAIDEKSNEQRCRFPLADVHEFFLKKITKSADSAEMRRDLARFRAESGLKLRQKIPKTVNFAKSAALSKNSACKKAERVVHHVPRWSDPWCHQRLAVLYCSYLSTPPSDCKILGFCLKPRIFVMHFYGRYDCTLGEYLERYCFDQSYLCANEGCDANMLQHVRKLVHGSRCVEISVQSVSGAPELVSTSSDDFQSIFAWDYCPRCKASPSATAAPSSGSPARRVSRDFYHLSFAKFVDYLVNGRRNFKVGGCGKTDAIDAAVANNCCKCCALHARTHHFARGRLVATFKTYAVPLRDVSLPGEHTDAATAAPLTAPLCNVGGVIAEQMTSDGDKTGFSATEKNYPTIGNDVSLEDGAILKENVSAKMTTRHLSEDDEYAVTRLKNDAERIAGVLDAASDILVKLQDFVAKNEAMKGLKQLIAVLQNVIETYSPETSSPSNETSQVFYDSPAETCLRKTTRDKIRLAEAVQKWNLSIADWLNQSSTQKKRLDEKLQLPAVESTRLIPTDQQLPIKIEATPTFDQSKRQASFNILPAPDSSAAYSAREKSGAIADTPQLSRDSSVSDFTPTFETKDLLTTPTSDDQLALISKNTDQSASISKNVEQSQLKVGGAFNISTEGTPLSSGERKSLTKLLSAAALVSPFDSNEHYALQTAADWPPVIIREGEAGSIVAYALCSEEYKKKCSAVAKIWSRKRGVASPQGDMEAVLMAESVSTATPIEHISPVPSNDEDLSPHVELQFCDQSAKFYCKIFFAQQFRSIRRMSLISGQQHGRRNNGHTPHDETQPDDQSESSEWAERRFIDSLSRCDKWTPKGGKSGAVFQRTADKRFILKQISRFELQSFQKFAVDYFKYAKGACLERGGTSALAKIYGIFRVGLTNSQTSAAFKMDFLIMEYLFNGREVGKVYDLKGSVRNRMANVKFDADFSPKIAEDSSRHANVQSSLNSEQAVEDSVLLDVNLLRDVAQHTFYLLPRAKRTLDSALRADTHFLSSNHVMDYSLLCAIDKRAPDRLILGVIDYVRTYSWDKRLESWVKSTVTINNQLPTVVSPDIYRERFVDIMDVYFPAVPDRWTNLFDP